MMARAVLGGPAEEGRSNYQMVIMRCPDCQRAVQLGGGQRIPVSPETVELAECDAQHVHIEDELHAKPHAPSAEPPLASCTRTRYRLSYR